MAHLFVDASFKPHGRRASDISKLESVCDRAEQRLKRRDAEVQKLMADVRTAKALHEGGKIGEVIHSFPLTKALGEALGVHSALEGWIVAMKVHDDSVWSRVKSGELAAFSIGGMGKRNAV